MRRLLAALALCLTVLPLAFAADLTVTGTVRGRDGRPIPEARVLLIREPTTAGVLAAAAKGAAHPEPLAHAQTDARGAFRLAAPGAGFYVVRVEAAGFAPVRATLSPLLRDLELETARLDADAGLTVRVTGPDGKPVAGATVVAASGSAPQRRFGPFGAATWAPARRVATAGPDGAAKLPRAADETLDLAAAAPQGLFAEKTSNRSAAVSLALGAGPPRPIEVRGEDGKPVAGVTVGAGAAWAPLGTTDAAGRVTLRGGGTTAVDVIVEAADGASADADIGAPAPAAKGAAPAPRVLTLPALQPVSGRVIDALTRHAIQGALVWASSRSQHAVTTDGEGHYTVAVRSTHNEDAIDAAAAGYLEAPPMFRSLPRAGEKGPTIALKPGAMVEGQVVDAAGNAIEGVAISAAIKPPQGGAMMRISFGRPRSSARTATHEDGRFTLGPLDVEESWRLDATRAGHAPAQADTPELVPGRTAGGVRIVMAAGATLRGTVTDADGKPIAGATVSAARAAASGNPLGRMMALTAAATDAGPQATSDAGGVFAVTDLSAGRWDLTVKRTGFATRQVPGVEVADASAGKESDAGAITLEPSVRIDGQVVSQDGKPLEGVEVRIIGSDPFARFALFRDDPPDATTLADGYFSIDGRRRGEKVDVIAGRTGYVRETLSGVEAPNATPLSIKLRAASTVSGTVTDLEGRVIPGARVDMMRTSGAMGMGAQISMRMASSARTDDDGQFTFKDVEPGKVGLSAAADGYQDATLGDVEVPAGKDLTKLQVKLEPGATVEGHVLGPDGLPAIGARVGLASSGGAGGPRGRMIDSALADGDGYYRLEGLKAGQQSVEATHDDYPRTVRDIEVKPGSNALDLQFTGGQSVSGVVLDQNGAPLDGARVQIHNAARPWGGQQATSANGGQFTLQGVVDGEQSLSAYKTGYAASQEEVKVTVAGQPVTGVALRLAAGGTLTGTVTGLEAKQFADVTVVAQGSGTAGIFGAFGTSSVDYKGTYRVEGLAAGKYQLRAMLGTSGRQATGEATLAEGGGETRADLAFGQGLTLSGRAVIGETPVAGATILVRARDLANAGGQSRTDVDGRFSLDGLDPATYNVSLVDFQKGLSYEESIELQSSREVVLRLPTATVSGRILDARDRAPLAGVSVTLSPQSGAQDGLMAFLGRGALTGQDGSFTMGNVPEGTWRVSASKEGYATATNMVSVMKSQNTAPLEVVLDATGGLILDVRLPGGGVPDAIEVAALDGAGVVAVSGSFSTGENGRVRITALPAGSWQLLIEGGGSAVTPVSASAPGGPLPVVLQPATTLTVTVKDLAGSRAMAQASAVNENGVVHRSLGWRGNLRGTMPVIEGSASFNDLPPGTWTITVTGSDGKTWQGRTTTTAGTPATLAL